MGTRLRYGRLFISALLVSVVTVTSAVVVLLTPASAESDCRTVEFTAQNVPLVVSTPARIQGTLCAGPNDQVIHLLVPGATYNRSYWDFPYQPEKYSYVDAMRSSGVGIATLAIDRLSTGESARPVSAEMSLLTHVDVIRQLISALRDGNLGKSFDKVILVGHSFGTLISYGLIGADPNAIDGLISTGVSRGPDPLGLIRILITFSHPAAAGEGGRFTGLDPGYLTTIPGRRADFYYTPAADPNVIAVDEATKEPQSLTDLGTVALPLLNTLNFRGPVLNVMGDRDLVFCQLIPCSSPLSLWNAEPALFPQASSYDSLVVPETGHDINLHPKAHLFFDRAISWTKKIMDD
ncbi:MAG: alpha/beta hydrolase [Corynebacteriales bacterium]|nr:alpha/beta hydrolase [Mycobacteriales bacterium]